MLHFEVAAVVAGGGLRRSNYFAPVAPPGEGEGAGVPANPVHCCGPSVAAVGEAPRGEAGAVAGPQAGAVGAEGLLPLLLLPLLLLPTQLRRT